MAKGSKRISDSCHVLTLRLHTDGHGSHVLDEAFETCRRFRNSIAGNARHGLMRLMQDKEYRSLTSALKSEKDKENRKALTKRLSDIRTSYGLGSFYQFAKIIAPIRNGYFNRKHLPSHVAQTLAADAWDGIEKILFANGKNLSALSPERFRTIRGKSNDTAIRFDPVAMKLRYAGLEIDVMSSPDPYIKEGLAKIRKSFRSNEALPGCIRYCTIVRDLVNDHGTVRWGYRLRVTVDGRAPKREAVRKPVQQRTLAIDPSQALMACADSEGSAFFLFMDGKDPVMERKRSETAFRMDASRRATNPERYAPGGTYIKGSVNVKTGRKYDWNRSDNYEKLLRRRRFLMQKQSETLRNRRNAICNNLASVYTEVKTEDMKYLSLSVRCKRTRFVKGGTIASKRRFGSTIYRFAPSDFLATLKRKIEGNGGTWSAINPWTLKASQYDPTDGTYKKHKLSERVYCLSDGTPVQRDLFSALAILCSQSETVDGRQRDVPDGDAMLTMMDVFIASMDEEMERVCSMDSKRSVPTVTGTGAWTALRGAKAGENDADAPSNQAKIPARPTDDRGGSASDPASAASESSRASENNLQYKKYISTEEPHGFSRGSSQFRIIQKVVDVGMIHDYAFLCFLSMG